MHRLFDVDPVVPNGFSYTPNFISTEEEAELITMIKDLELAPMNFQGYTAKRKVASFGYDWNFTERKLSKGKAIPSQFEHLILRVANTRNIEANTIAELLVTEYPVGSVINWHRDAPPFDSIFGLSLHSDCLFKLRPYDKALQNRKSIITLPVRRRSLYVMEKEARSEWEHSIAPVADVRYSITIRTLRTDLP